MILFLTGFVFDGFGKWAVVSRQRGARSKTVIIGLATGPLELHWNCVVYVFIVKDGFIICSCCFK